MTLAALIGYASGHGSELEVVARAAMPLVVVAACAAVVIVPFSKRARPNSGVALASAAVSMVIGVVVVAWLL